MVILDKTYTKKSFYSRKQELENLAKELLENETVQENIISSYMNTTGFTHTNLMNREILEPAAILKNLGAPNEFIDWELEDMTERKPLGKVAVLLPKNGIGITFAKAAAAAYLMGNNTIIKFPRQLAKTADVLQNLYIRHLEDLAFAPINISSKNFLRQCMLAPEIKAVVIYGDDKWINDYALLARRTGTKLIFEGPGNDPQVVLPDADIDNAVDNAIKGGMNNGGQSCSALERFFIHDAIYEEFSERLIDRLSTVKYGSPKDKAVELGPLYSETVLKRIQHQIEEAVLKGGKLKLGGKIKPSGYQNLQVCLPTVLTDCQLDMKVVANETFGPVFPLVRFGNNLADLLNALDQTDYGLNATLCTSKQWSEDSATIWHYLKSTHRNIYLNSNATSPENRPSRILDGGFKRSGFVWERTDRSYIQREGRRYLLEELSKSIGA